MEVTYYLDEGVCEIEGKKECLCMGEPYYGTSNVTLGTHYGCTNLLRLILVGNALAIEKEPINVIRVYPEKTSRRLEDMKVPIDNTEVEYCHDDKVVHQTTWLHVKNNVMPAVNAIRDMDPKLIIDLMKGLSGKTCRGLSLKYLPAKPVRSEASALTPQQRKIIMDAMNKVSYEEVVDRYHQLHPDEVFIDARTGKPYVPKVPIDPNAPRDAPGPTVTVEYRKADTPPTESMPVLPEPSSTVTTETLETPTVPPDTTVHKDE